MSSASIRSEQGSALATAIILLSVMLTVGLAAFSLSDNGQRRALDQRQRESSLNLTEGVLYSQGFSLAQSWPGSPTAAAVIPASCTEASVDALCPRASTLAAANAGASDAPNFTNVDVSRGVTWTTRIRDNGGPLAGAYVPAQSDAAQSGTNLETGLAYSCAAPCKYDANGDKQLWVQARSVVRGKPRNVSALLKLERLLENTPKSAVTAGGITVSNNGNNTMIYAQPDSEVLVRCNVSSSGCAEYDPGQIDPAPKSVAAPSLLTPAQLERFKQRAISDGRYFAGCPGDDISGAVVWVESCTDLKITNSTRTEACNPAAPPKPTGGGNGLAQTCINQYTRPGIFILHCGNVDLSGQITYVGILYGVNNSDGTCAGSGPQARGNGKCKGKQNSDDNVISMSGGFGVWGVLAIDGQGCLLAGSNGIQVQFDPNVFRGVASYGTVGLVQNTWRELEPGT